jgi:Holliday junction resolvase RusA-like endonuclease
MSMTPSIRTIFLEINMVYEYIILGDPIPLARPRHGGGKTWDPQKQLKLAWSMQLQDQHYNKPFFEGPLHIDLIFFMPKPKTSAKQTALLEGKPHYIKPDLDNCIKFVFDCGNNVLYKDDASIASMTAKKKYSNTPRTLIQVTPYSEFTRDTSLLPDIYESF